MKNMIHCFIPYNYSKNVADNVNLLPANLNKYLIYLFYLSQRCAVRIGAVLLPIKMIKARGFTFP